MTKLHQFSTKLKYVAYIYTEIASCLKNATFSAACSSVYVGNGFNPGISVVGHQRCRWKIGSVSDVIIVLVLFVCRSL
jgi:hypothetical protein